MLQLQAYYSNVPSVCQRGWGKPVKKNYCKIKMLVNAGTQSPPFQKCNDSCQVLKLIIHRTIRILSGGLTVSRTGTSSGMEMFAHRCQTQLQVWAGHLCRFTWVCLYFEYTGATFSSVCMERKENQKWERNTGQKILYLNKMKYDSEIWLRVSKECEMCSLHLDEEIYLYYYP